MSILTWLLGFVCAAQFAVILKLLHDNHHHQTNVDEKLTFKEVLSRTKKRKSENNATSSRIVSTIPSLEGAQAGTPGIRAESEKSTAISSFTKVTTVLPLVQGVAVTVFLGSPKWFQNRYSTMVNQVLVSLGSGWQVQIFYARKKMAVEGTLYPGIQKHVNAGRVVLTPLPTTFKGIKKKDLMIQPWLWRSMLSDTVLLFGGSTVVCANSPYDIDSFLKFDFLGGPWSALKGIGGDGALSVRNRTLMVQALEEYVLEPMELTSSSSSPSRSSSPINHHHQPSTTLREAKAIHANKREEMVFIEALQAMQAATPPALASTPSAPSSPVRIARAGDTHRFVSTEGWWTQGSFGAVGTMGPLNHTARQQFLDYCPELKILFPVLHYPDCFGAEPDPLLCIKAVCEHGGIRCAEALVKKHKESTKNGQSKARGDTKEGTVISTDWFNAKRNIKLKLSLEYMSP